MKANISSASVPLHSSYFHEFLKKSVVSESLALWFLHLCFQLCLYFWIDYLQSSYGIQCTYAKISLRLLSTVVIILIDQWNHIARLYGIQVTAIYSRAILVAMTSECRVKRVICKTWTGTLANSADPDQTPQKGLHYVHKLHEIRCYIKVLSPRFRLIFFQHTLRDNRPKVLSVLWCISVWSRNKT